MERDGFRHIGLCAGCLVLSLSASVAASGRQRIVTSGSQTEPVNFVATCTPQFASDDLGELDMGVPTTVQYYDGLGSLVQTVSAMQGNGQANCIRDWRAYDCRGRVRNVYQSVGQTSGEAVFMPLPLLQTYAEDPDYGFTILEYEQTPEGQASESRKPGQAWHGAAQGLSTVHTYNQGTPGNALFACRLKYSGGEIQSAGDYPDGELDVEHLTDEDGEQTLTFTDMRGCTVLSRRITAGARAATPTPCTTRKAVRCTRCRPRPRPF